MGSKKPIPGFGALAGGPTAWHDWRKGTEQDELSVSLRNEGGMGTILEPSRQESLDTLFQGKLAVIQGKTGYRFSLDAVLLAHFARARGGDEVMDLGTGNGVIPLILALRNPSLRVVGLEIQESMVHRARRNAALNGLSGRVEIVQGDVRSVERLFPPGKFYLVVCNPPYRAPRSGRINPDPEKQVARHEIKGRLRDFIRAGVYLLRRGGVMAVVYPAARMVDLHHAMRQEGIEPKRMRLVHSFEGGPASLILAEGVKSGRSELEIMSPLFVYSAPGKYTEELCRILSGP